MGMPGKRKPAPEYIAQYHSECPHCNRDVYKSVVRSHHNVAICTTCYDNYRDNIRLNKAKGIDIQLLEERADKVMNVLVDVSDSADKAREMIADLFYE